MLLGEPANKETSPLGVIFRIQLLPWSATKTLPLTSTATPTGFRKRAALPLALVVPDTPVAEPANKLTLMPSAGPVRVTEAPLQIAVEPLVVTVGVVRPQKDSFRIVWPERSAITKLPAPSTSSPLGPLRLDVKAGPLTVLWLLLPATVVTTPAGVTFLIRLLPKSAINKLPAASKARPAGELNEALVPVPSAKPCVKLVPAKVVTTPACVTFRMIIRVA